MSEKSAGSRKSKTKDEADCCCCTYDIVIILLGILVWIAGLFMFINIIGMYLNQYFPWWYPTVQLFLFFIFTGGMVMIASWFCSDSSGTRLTLRIACILILSSTVLIFIWNLIYVFGCVKTRHMMIGTGDKDVEDNYED